MKQPRLIGGFQCCNCGMVACRFKGFGYGDRQYDYRRDLCGYVGKVHQHFDTLRWQAGRRKYPGDDGYVRGKQ